MDCMVAVPQVEGRSVGSKLQNRSGFHRFFLCPNQVLV